MGLVKATDAFDQERGVPIFHLMRKCPGHFRRDAPLIPGWRNSQGFTNAQRAVAKGGSDEGTAFDTTGAGANHRQRAGRFAGTGDSGSGKALSAAAPALSLTGSDEEGAPQIDLPVESPEEELADSISLRQVLALLEEKDQMLIRLRYFKGKTQVETAAVLGMTQVQVSRREKKILLRLRELLL